jgi:hypothetical protein
MNLDINEKGSNFYKKWYKDSWRSFFVAAPIMLIFFGTCFSLIVGISILLLLILILPVLLIMLGFVYTPLVSRKKYLNKLIKRVVLNERVTEIETYPWFIYKAILIKAELSDLKIYEVQDDSLFKDKKVFWVEYNKHSSEGFYLIEEFFDNAEDFIKVTNG